MTRKKPDKADRCSQCMMRLRLCICDLMDSLDLRTRLSIIFHFKELRTTTNTGRIARIFLKNSAQWVRGEENKPLDDAGLVLPEYENLFLFPSNSAVELSKDFVSTLKKPANLIVPDGNWRQAQKMVFRIPSLKNLQTVKLPLGPPTKYRLRKETKENGLATFEAISRAFGFLEGPKVQAQLDYIFEVMVDRVLWSRAELRREDTTHIPKDVLQP